LLDLSGFLSLMMVQQKKQSRSVQGMASTVTKSRRFILFADNVLRRIEAPGENMLRVSSGRWELIGVSGMLSVLTKLLF
jgi:hypothetical protein